MRRILVLTVVVVLVATIGYALGRSRLPVDISPSGPYAVGVGRHDWVDRSRIDQFSPRGGEPRTLSAWVWYPAVPGQGTPSPYAPGQWDGLHKYGWAQTGFDHIRTGTRDDPPSLPGRFPLVVLLPGLGLSAPQYQAIASGIASRGYFVAGVTPTYSAKLTVLSGRAVPASRAGDPSRLTGTARDQLLSVWTADARFAATRAGLQYNGHVDRSRVVYVGHELGGAAAVAACHSDAHCAGAVSVGGPPGGDSLSRPLLLLNTGTSALSRKSANSGSAVKSGESSNSGSPAGKSGNSGSAATSTGAPKSGFPAGGPGNSGPGEFLNSGPSVAPAEAGKSGATATSGRSRSSDSATGRAAVWAYTIGGAGPLSVTDFAAYRLAWPLRQLLPLGSLGGRRELDITAGYLGAFLQTSFRGTPWRPPADPEVRADVVSRG